MCLTLPSLASYVVTGAHLREPGMIFLAKNTCIKDTPSTGKSKYVKEEVLISVMRGSVEAQ